MVLTFRRGSKCAVMLPRKTINIQLTPAKGLIINQLLDSKSLVLVEEVWQFKGLETSPLSEMCISGGRIRHNNWGWMEVPKIVKKDDYLVIKAEHYNLMEPTEEVLSAMIKRSIKDFRSIRGSLFSDGKK